MDVLHRLYRSLICLTVYLKVTMAPYVLHYRALAGRMGNSCRRKDEDLP